MSWFESTTDRINNRGWEQLLDVSKYNRLTLQTTRGCPLDCSFCAASRTISSFKIKPLSHVRSEIEALLKAWPKPFVELADDNTFVSKDCGRQLASLLQEYDLRWFTETDISVADDDALLESLARSGCAQLLIGLEATDAAALYGVDRKNWKHEKAARYLESIKKIQSFGIPVNGCFIFGFDEQGEETFERVRHFVDESELCDVQITVLTPFPGTRLYSQLKQQGRLFKDVFWDECTLFDLTFEPKRLSAGAFIDRFGELMTALYNDDAKRKRNVRVRRCLRSSAGASPTNVKTNGLGQ